ncbi:DUF4397 domain-containing protein [uncultured Gelidibacter sp.]|uniref:DUF4397 domain-containing protein n=1 Tax=uncultured Gelidibacter sp. TaxID=259318 RepID=UPI002604E1EC|nr:DUF4397 domain-containing protein [uncultured Gelidibacter sp.]
MRKAINKLIILCAVSLVFTACDENAIPEITEPVSDTATFVKFFLHAEDAPAVNFYLDDKKVSAIASSSSDEERGNSYGSVFPSNAYALIPSGTFNLYARDLEGNVIATNSVTFDADKHYSAYLGGTAESGYEIFTIVDPLPAPDNVKIYWRFVNTMSNMPFSVDVYAVKAAVPATETTPAEPVKIINLGMDLDYKEAGEYKELEPGRYNFRVFASGTEYEVETSTPYIQNTLTLASKGRVYSTQIRGSYKETPTSKNIDYWRER